MLPMRTLAVTAGLALLALLSAAVARDRHHHDQDDATRPATAPAGQSDTQPERHGASSAPAGKPQRILLRVNRNLEVKGFLELEDDDVIVVRDLQGQLQSFPKA